MIARRIRMQSLFGSKNMNVSDRANEENGRRSSPEPFSWYFAQRALPELKHVATVNGYVVLP